MTDLHAQVSSNNSKSQTYVDVTFCPIIEPSDPKLYKTQSVCKICQKRLKGNRFSKAKRFNCKFCHFAVCSECSNLRCFHSDMQKVKRTCIGCFNDSVQKSLKEKAKSLIPKLIKGAIEQSKMSLNEVKTLEEQSQVIKESIRKKKEKLEETMKFIEILRNEVLADQAKNKVGLNLGEEEIQNDDFNKLSESLEEPDRKIIENGHKEKFSSVESNSLEKNPKLDDYLIKKSKQKVSKLNTKYQELTLEINSNENIIQELQVKVENNEKILASSIKDQKVFIEKSILVLKDQISMNRGMFNTLSKEISKLEDKQNVQLKKQEACLIF